MVLSYRIFRTLPLDQQLPMLWAHGRYLARRWGEETVVLYALFGFFCEVHYDAEANALLRTHSFWAPPDWRATSPALGWESWPGRGPSRVRWSS